MINFCYHLLKINSNSHPIFDFFSDRKTKLKRFKETIKDFVEFKIFIEDSLLNGQVRIINTDENMFQAGSALKSKPIISEERRETRSE